MDESKWPNKNSREKYEINEFISAYKQKYGRSLVVESKRENPDYFLRDTASGDILGVELTSVYLDDRSVPDVHKKPVEGTEEIPDDDDAMEKYRKRLIQAIAEKICKARKNYDTTHPLVLSVYVNEYISIYMHKKDWEEFVKRYEEVFDAMAPFSEVIFWSLPNDGVFYVWPDPK